CASTPRRGGSAIVPSTTASTVCSSRHGIGRCYTRPCLGLEDKWARQLDAARAAWPTVETAVDEVVAVLEQRAGATETPDAIPVADVYIAVACARGETSALRAFEARYFTGIGPALARISTDA